MKEISFKNPFSFFDVRFIFSVLPDGWFENSNIYFYRNGFITSQLKELLEKGEGQIRQISEELGTRLES